MKCPTDGQVVTSYTVTAQHYKSAGQRLTVTLKPCGHEVDHMTSSLDPQSSTTPGQSVPGATLTPWN